MELREGYIKTEVGTLPVDWELKPFYKITDAITCGVAATPKYVDESEGKPFLSASHVQNGKVIPLDYKYIPVELYNQITKHNKPEKGDILYTRVGAGIGEAGVIDFDLDFAIYVSLTLIKPKKNLNSYYLKSLLNSDYYRFLAKRDQFAGGGVQNLNVGVVREFPIPIPPTIEEQTAIANALSDTDALINSLEKLIAKKRNIKQGAMQKLLQPKEGWEVKKLGEIAEVRDGTHQTPTYVESGIPFYSVESVTNNDFKNTKYITEEAHKLLTKTFKIEKGDILMTRIGSIGDCKLVDWDVNASFYVSLALLKIKRGFSSEYICHFSKTEYFKKEADINSLQSAIPKKINLGPISNIKILMPVYDEQVRIATILSDMDAEIAALEAKLEKYKKVKLGMMQNLLTGKIRLV